MSDSDKPDTQALILKQLKSIKVALCLVVVIMLLLSGVIVVGGVVVGIAAFKSNDHYGGYPDPVDRREEYIPMDEAGESATVVTRTIPFLTNSVVPMVTNSASATE